MLIIWLSSLRDVYKANSKSAILLLLINLAASYYAIKLSVKFNIIWLNLVLSYGTLSPTRLLNYCCFMIALYVIIIGQ